MIIKKNTSHTFQSEYESRDNPPEKLTISKSCTKNQHKFMDSNSRIIPVEVSDMKKKGNNNPKELISIISTELV